MPDIELERPEIDDVDEGAPAFRRRLALVVVLITLFGTLVAYLQTVESNREENAARDAQIFSIEGLGDQVDATAGLAAGARVLAERQILIQREALNAGRAVQAPAASGVADRYEAAADRYQRMRDVIAPLLPRPAEEFVEDEEEGEGEAGEGSFEEPLDIATLAADLEVGPDVARLRQAVQADLANDHGSKADTFVAVLTVLAVALFLIGLSLTVQGRSRLVLAAPGCVIALVCVGWTATVMSRPVTNVSDDAVVLAAEGLRHMTAGNFEAAIDALDEAVDDSPEFAAAFARRGDAAFLAGSPQLGQTNFISVTSEDGLRDAIDDLERALELGAGNDLQTVAGLAFYRFLDGDFGGSASLSEDALDLNDQRPEIWFNLGVAEVGAGNEREARRAYRQGMEVLERDPDEFRRTQILAGARTDLSIVRTIVDDDDLDDVEELAAELESDLAAFEAEITPLACSAEPCPTVDDVAADAAATDFVFSDDGANVFADYELTGVPAGTPLIHVWYHRANPSDPFTQTAQPTEIARSFETGNFSFTSATFEFCPVPGEYFVQVYAGGQLLGESTGTIAAGPLGGEFTNFADPIEGIDVCVPAGFDREFVELEPGSDDRFLILANTDTGITFAFNAFHGALGDDLDPVFVMDEAVITVAGSDADIQDSSVNGRTITNAAVDLPARSAVFEDGSGIVVSSIGPDGVLRTVIMNGSTDPAVMDELLSVLFFTGLPAGSEG